MAPAVQKDPLSAASLLLLRDLWHLPAYLTNPLYEY